MLNYHIVSPWLCFNNNIILFSEQMESTSFQDRAGRVCEIRMTWN